MSSPDGPLSGRRMFWLLLPCFLIAAGMFYRSQFGPPPPQPVAPPRPTVPAPSQPPGSPFQVSIKAIPGDPARAAAGLDEVLVLVANDGKRVVAYYLAKPPDDEPAKIALQAAWDGIRPQLPANAKPAVHLVALRTRPITFDGNPPPSRDPNVVAHAVVRPAEAGGGWPKKLSEWR